MTQTMTQGRKLADNLRKNFGVGPRSRRYRNGVDLHADMIEALQNATFYPGYYSGERNEIFTAAYGVYLSYIKHVDGYRIDGALRYRISQMSPHAFAGLLGDMLDAGVSNVGEGERYFSSMR